MVWASNTGRPCGKKPSRTLAGPSRDAKDQVKSQGGNAATRRTVQSGERAWTAAITTAKTPEAAATARVRPHTTGHESSGTGKTSHAGKPEPSGHRHITKGTRTNQRISVPRRFAGPLPRPAVVQQPHDWGCRTNLLGVGGDQANREPQIETPRRPSLASNPSTSHLQRSAE